MSTRPGISRSFLSHLMVALGLLLCSGMLFAQPRTASKGQRAVPATSGPQVYKSRNFQLMTDLSAEEARELLDRLETMLGLVSSYWGRPHRGVIDMYVVDNLNRWPEANLRQMAPEGLACIQARGGLTIGMIHSRGNEFRSKAVVYATSDHGTPQHEAVHAYCMHVFGNTGPVWYSEGMAEVGQYWRAADKSVQIHPEVLRYLQESPRRPLGHIVNNPLETTGDSWQNYAWRWVLCHLLGHNTNYTDRFKPLGLSMLTKNDASFTQVYGAQAPEIRFEYDQLLDNIEQGYRVDLCSWDWKTPCRSPRGVTATLAKIDAGRGWQPSRVRVLADTEYEYSATGQWKTSPEGRPVDATGDDQGQGRLIGTLFHDYVLSEPVTFGTSGTWTAPEDGDLHLRCEDAWGEIADNTGTIVFRMKIAGKGRPLVDPHAPSAEPAARADDTDSE